ncbi:MAG TPA: queuosine salvage family protein [Dehalococcoidia bacterium]|nr:queuosine salvage family protein [Dehalococcoidia bacterium]
MASILDEVRVACARVADQARWVRIDDARLEAYAGSLPGQAAMEGVASKYYYAGTPEETSAFVLTFTSVNFSSGWNPHLRKLPGSSGSITLMTRLRQRFEEKGAMTADELAGITAGDCAALFGQVIEPPVDELMDLFAQGWNDLGRYLLERFDGSFSGVVEAAGHSAERLIELLLAMPLYRDIARYRGSDVPLLKRAQIASADLSAAFGGQGPGRFDDLARLTIFPDNLVPHVLRLDGVLEYDEELIERINREELLAHGSEEEVEIRAVAVHAVERIVDVCRGQGREITAARLDDHLWLKGQGTSYKAVPRHRCRNPHY